MPRTQFDHSIRAAPYTQERLSAACKATGYTGYNLQVDVLD